MTCGAQVQGAGSLATHLALARAVPASSNNHITPAEAGEKCSPQAETAVPCCYAGIPDGCRSQPRRLLQPREQQHGGMHSVRDVAGQLFRRAGPAWGWQRQACRASRALAEAVSVATSHSRPYGHLLAGPAPPISPGTVRGYAPLLRWCVAGLVGAGMMRAMPSSFHRTASMPRCMVKCSLCNSSCHPVSTAIKCKPLDLIHSQESLRLLPSRPWARLPARMGHTAC